MGLLRQVFDILVALVLAIGLSSLLVAVGLAPSVATNFGLILGTMFYFSRYPWGYRHETDLNDRIDALYDRYLPI